MIKIKKLFIFFGLLFTVGILSAHEIRPGYLEIREVKGNKIEIFWKQPVSGESGINLIPVLSSGWLSDSLAVNSSNGIALIRQWTIHTRQSIAGQKITINGLKNTITDVLIKIYFADGKSITKILRPSEISFVISKTEQTALPVFDYLQLGVEHILLGIDHLLFVLALILLVKGRTTLFKTITAFTIAHSITLATATLGWVTVSSAPVEAVIALSIIFLAVELIHYYQGKMVLSSRYPWVVSFIFGLLHGLGFAGALANVGLPQDDIPLTLFLFNVGVEIGQLLFILVVLVVIWMLHRFFKQSEKYKKVVPYIIGSFAAYWFIERMAVILLK